jgi:hypothetical protein
MWKVKTRMTKGKKIGNNGSERERERNEHEMNAIVLLARQLP